MYNSHYTCGLFPFFRGVDLQEKFENVVFLLEVAGCLQKEHDFMVADDCFEGCISRCNARLEMQFDVFGGIFAWDASLLRAIFHVGIFGACSGSQE